MASFLAKKCARSILSMPGGSFLRMMSSLPSLEYVNVETAGTNNRVGLVTLNRPKALNALCSPLMDDLLTALKHFDADPGVGCVVVTGSPKAFAAGADIKEMQNREFAENFKIDFLNDWTSIVKVGLPIIAAVNGYALGGGNTNSVNKANL